MGENQTAKFESSTYEIAHDFINRHAKLDAREPKLNTPELNKLIEMKKEEGRITIKERVAALQELSKLDYSGRIDNQDKKQNQNTPQNQPQLKPEIQPDNAVTTSDGKPVVSGSGINITQGDPSDRTMYGGRKKNYLGLIKSRPCSGFFYKYYGKYILYKVTVIHVLYMLSLYTILKLFNIIHSNIKRNPTPISPFQSGIGKIGKEREGNSELEFVHSLCI